MSSVGMLASVETKTQLGMLGIVRYAVFRTTSSAVSECSLVFITGDLLVRTPLYQRCSLTALYTVTVV
jgi:hypothetical protein